VVLWRGYAKPSHLCGATLSVVMPAGYLHYNVVAKKLARRLQALGASACIEVGLGDDQHPQGYEAALDPWLALLWSTLRAKRPLPAGMTEVWCFGPHAIKAKTGSTCTIHISPAMLCSRTEVPSLPVAGEGSIARPLCLYPHSITCPETICKTFYAMHDLRVAQST